ncbi:MAG: glycosyltransferase family 4 protein [Candidatus Omnitrophota bacterium]
MKIIRSLNILLVTDSFYPDGFGGCHTYVYYLARGLIKKGHNVVVATIKLNDKLPTEEIIDQIKIFRYNTPVKGKLLFLLRPFNMYLNLGVKAPWKVSDFDIVHHHDLIAASAMYQLSRLKSVPACYTFHSSVYDDVTHQLKRKSYGLKLFNKLVLAAIKSMENYVLKKSKKIMVLSDFSKGYVLDNYPKTLPSKIEKVPGGVDGKNFYYIDRSKMNWDEQRDRLGLPKDKKIVFTARRLVARMGIENLIEAAVLLRKKRNDFFIAVFGDGFLKGQLQEMINLKGLQDNFKLMGRFDFKELPSFYHACDLFIMPSEFSEWFGLATIEALSCGLPVIGTPAGATGEILEGLDKRLVISGVTSAHIAEKISEFLGMNRSELLELGRIGREYVEAKYSWEKVVDGVEAVYLKMLDTNTN